MSLMSRLKAMNMELDSLDTLFVEQLKELYNVENQIIGALPEMAEAAHSPQLKSAFEQHLEVSRRQKARLEDIFHQIGQQPEEAKCEGISGILEEGQVLAQSRGKPEVRDAALISAAQQVEHYEMAGYGTCRTFAEQLGRQEIASILQQTLDEEKMADKRLTDIAESSINPEAARESRPM
jgi:ferritin-like metal-binding protein YciE